MGRPHRPFPRLPPRGRARRSGKLRAGDRLPSWINRFRSGKLRMRRRRNSLRLRMRRSRDRFRRPRRGQLFSRPRCLRHRWLLPRLRQSASPAPTAQAAPVSPPSVAPAPAQQPLRRPQCLRHRWLLPRLRQRRPRPKRDRKIRTLRIRRLATDRRRHPASTTSTSSHDTSRPTAWITSITSPWSWGPRCGS